MLVGENDPFPPLTSASPRLLFDFNSRFDESLGLGKDPPGDCTIPQSRSLSPLARHLLCSVRR